MRETKVEGSLNAEGRGPGLGFGEGDPQFHLPMSLKFDNMELNEPCRLEKLHLTTSFRCLTVIRCERAIGKKWTLSKLIAVKHLKKICLSLSITRSKQTIRVHSHWMIAKAKTKHSFDVYRSIIRIGILQMPLRGC